MSKSEDCKRKAAGVATATTATTVTATTAASAADKAVEEAKGLANRQKDVIVLGNHDDYDKLLEKVDLQLVLVLKALKADSDLRKKVAKGEFKTFPELCKEVSGESEAEEKPKEAKGKSEAKAEERPKSVEPKIETGVLGLLKPVYKFVLDNLEDKTSMKIIFDTDGNPAELRVLYMKTAKGFQVVTPAKAKALVEDVTNPFAIPEIFGYYKIVVEINGEGKLVGFSPVEGSDKLAFKSSTKYVLD